jgi:hypothetical protein
MKRRITLFLDLDGVLIITKPWDSDLMGKDGYSLFKKGLIDNLNELLKVENFAIVLSSARRKNLNLEKFNKVFERRGINQKITSYVPFYSSSKSRKEELERYILEKNINDFIILDDDKSLNALKPFYKKRLILTKQMIGFSKIKLEEAKLKSSKTEYYS